MYELVGFNQLTVCILNSVCTHKYCSYSNMKLHVRIHSTVESLYQGPSKLGHLSNRDAAICCPSYVYIREMYVSLK